jgi:hypothetical protein
MGLNPLLFMCVSFVYGDPLFVRVDIFPLFLWSLIVHAFSHTHSWCFFNSLSHDGCEYDTQNNQSNHMEALNGSFCM